jgi:hypothetical protein
MAGIRKETQRSQKIILLSQAMKEVFFNDTLPNSFQIRNNGTGIIYLSSGAQVNKNVFEIQINAGGTRVYTNPKGLKYLYLYCEVDCEAIVNSYEADEVYPADLDQTQQTVILNGGAQSVVEVSKVSQPLPAGANNIGKVDVATMPAVTAPTIGKVDLTAAGTEYSYTLPNGTKKFTANIKDLDSTAVIQYYYATGAANTLQYTGDIGYSEEGLNTNGLTLYFKSSIAGKVMQIISWK